MLNPKAIDLVVGFILHDSIGEGARTWLLRQRLNMIDVEISSHCAVLNSDPKMALIWEANKLAGVMGEVSFKQEQEKAAKKAAKEREEAKKKQRKEIWDTAVAKRDL